MLLPLCVSSSSGDNFFKSNVPDYLSIVNVQELFALFATNTEVTVQDENQMSGLKPHVV